MSNWYKLVMFLCLFATTLAQAAVGQDSANPQSSPSIRLLGPTPPLHVDPAKALFLQLESVGLDPAQVYHIRDVALDRAAFHITLADGEIGFTTDVAGQVTGAFFVGEGEILLTPPNQLERASMMLQTGAAILEERFSSAYFRFNDDTFAEMRPLLTLSENPQEFTSQWDAVARNLAHADALRLFMTFSRLLPVSGEPPGSEHADSDDRFLHARLQGETKGTFDVYFDSNSPEQVWAAQPRSVDGITYYDVWTSFPFLPKNKYYGGANSIAVEEGQASALDIISCTVKAQISPPTNIQADAVLDLKIRQGGQRSVLFELARTLVIAKVEAEGQPVEFIHNPSIEGTQLSRRGNDLVAVVFPNPIHAGQEIKLHFVYGGDVLSEAGPGLLYVGDRGTWYPNRGMTMTRFNLEFHYPPGWTLVATGKRTDPIPPPNSSPAAIIPNSGEQVSYWISERPIPFAGFNLGKYRKAETQAGKVSIEAYGTAALERGFPQAESQQPLIPPPIGKEAIPLAISPFPPSPAKNVEMVAAKAAHAIDFYSARFGPYPLSALALTQMPGNLSQGWPGLVFLSSLSFLNAEERSALHMGPVEKTLISSVIAHETAHQWWGDLVTWDDYRDQWISEGLANYSAMMLLQQENPNEFHAVMEKFRDDLLQKNKSGAPLLEDGPVTLGNRLSCSEFPTGYEAISYGRGTWLFHMLRTMMRDAEPARQRLNYGPGDENEPFLRALRRLREQYEGRPITTREMMKVFQEELPPSLWYEGRKSLDWFYQGWINGIAIPRFELRAVKFSDNGGKTIASGTIFQQDAPKDLVTPVPLYAARGGNLVFLGRVFADGPQTPFHLSVPAATKKIVLDPNQTLLARAR